MLSFDEKRRVVNLLVDRVIVTGNEVRIEGVIPPIGNTKPNPPEDVGIASHSSP